jgi:hypothetical protein
MSVVTAQIEIAASPQEVWDFVMDPECSHRWVTIHRGLKGHSDGPLVVGYEMQQTLCLRGVKFGVDWKLEECDIPSLGVWEGRGPARSKARIENRLTETADGGTHFDYRNEFKAPMGPLGAVASKALVGGIPEKEANASLAKLKRLLEGR